MKLPLLLVCIALASVAGCEQEAVSPAALQLVSASVTPDGSVGATDSIAFTVTTFNPSGRAIEFPTGRPFAFDVIVNTPDRSVIWRLLRGAFGSPATPFSIAPGQSDTWTAVWWLEDLNGDRVPAGSYSVIGIIGQDLNAPILETEPLEILVAAPGG